MIFFRKRFFPLCVTWLIICTITQSQAAKLLFDGMLGSNGVILGDFFVGQEFSADSIEVFLGATTFDVADWVDPFEVSKKYINLDLYVKYDNKQHGFLSGFVNNWSSWDNTEIRADIMQRTAKFNTLQATSKKYAQSEPIKLLEHNLNNNHAFNVTYSYNVDYALKYYLSYIPNLNFAVLADKSNIQYTDLHFVDQGLVFYSEHKGLGLGLDLGIRVNMSDFTLGDIKITQRFDTFGVSMISHLAVGHNNLKNSFDNLQYIGFGIDINYSILNFLTSVSYGQVYAKDVNKQDYINKTLTLTLGYQAQRDIFLNISGFMQGDKFDNLGFLVGLTFLHID